MAAARTPGRVPATEAIPVEDAGVVLLHPFLARFFSAVGLTEGRAFRDETARGRAACLVRWLASGVPVEEEHGLALAKVLCGIPLEEVVVPIGTPTDEERAEGDSLLVQVASAWPALRSRSEAMLRATFLLRPGLLAGGPSSWELRLEARGWDVLLDALPWGISVVKTPFMPGILRVER